MVFTEAMVGNTVLHVPPLEALVRVMLLPTQTEVGPLMGVTTGTVFTEMTLRAMAVPQPAVTV